MMQQKIDNIFLESDEIKNRDRRRETGQQRRASVTILFQDRLRVIIQISR